MTAPKDPKDYKRLGRPPFPYDEILGKEICKAIATSAIGLERLCELNDHWPDANKIYEWCYELPKFGDMYAQAREAQQECLIASMAKRCADDSNDMYPDGQGNLRPNMAKIARDKLIADNTKWVAARLSRRYRDKQDVVSTVVHEDKLKDLS